MIITVGSSNQTKVEAVRQAVSLYDCLREYDVVGVSVDSGVSSQPVTQLEGIQGAMNRAHAAFYVNHNRHPVFGVGLESALIPMPDTHSGRVDVTYCFFYDGFNYSPLGMSPGFEQPQEVVSCVLKDSLEISDAYRRCGLTDKAKIDEHQGSIGYMSADKIHRTEYNKLAVMMALMHLVRS